MILPPFSSTGGDPVGSEGEKYSARLWGDSRMDGGPAISRPQSTQDHAGHSVRTAWKEHEVSPVLCHLPVCPMDLEGIQEDFFIIKIVFGDLRKGVV